MIEEGPCKDPTCYRGAYGRNWGYQFKDGPCDARDCKWPPDQETRPHFTDTPSNPVRDAGKEALLELILKEHG